ncbi:hypothetical protein LCGC14_0016920 [marine sediment metagenome]|uniref:Uncharacterized protein n=1 Tax=marine sediment metagenome TaxID=412755 RepID=A0A0F9W1N2_9ZZZZ|nr:hypothetical protein [Phycisphaerae bacterium]HDZ42400.1 hypothetical protein [Phycisphaerae bacterium]
MKATTSWFSLAMFVIFAVSLKAVAATPTLNSDAEPRGTTYLVFELHGGRWHDAEKDYADGGYEDGFMCWAAVASNMLAWGGWNEGTDLADEDAIWEYFQTHWVSGGGHPLFAIIWWFRGGDRGYPKRNVPGGGGFYPDLNIRDYVSGPHLGAAGALDRIRKNTVEGYVSGINLRHPKVNFSHTVTCWGVNVDDETDQVIGIWITDSDDDPNGEPPRANYLRYFEVETHGGRTHVQGYSHGRGTNAYIINQVLGLAANPARPQPVAAEEPAPAPAEEPESSQTTRSLSMWPALGIALTPLGACVWFLSRRRRQGQD